MTDSPAVDLATFGETMIRLAAPDHTKLIQTTTLDLSIGGTESNLAVALAHLGRRVRWVSALPDNPLGSRVAADLRREGVDVSRVIWGNGARVGVYFLEFGSTPRPTRVIYDRKDSAVAQLDPDAVDLSLAVECRILHLTGITPALSRGCAEICNRLADAARDAGHPVSVDVNYRALLWSSEDARAGLQPLLDRATLLFCGAGDAATVWGLDSDPRAVAEGLLEQSAAELVVLTLGADGAVTLDRTGRFTAQSSAAVEIVDPIGAGDALAAGFLHRWLDDPDDHQSALRSGVALATLAMTIPGDLTMVSPEELRQGESHLAGLATDIVR